MAFCKYVLYWEMKPDYTYPDQVLKILEVNGLAPFTGYGNAKQYNARMPNTALEQMSCCYFDMVARLMEPIPAPFTQLNIILTVPGSEPRVGSAIEGIRDLFLPYDPWPFFDMDELCKMEMLADITLRALDLLEASTGLDCRPAREAIALARGAGFRNVWVALRKRSKAGLTAEVGVEHDTRGATVWMTVLNRRGQMLRRVPVLRTGPEAYALKRDYLKELSWDGDTVTLSSDVSDFSFSLDALTGETAFVHTFGNRWQMEHGDYGTDLSGVPPQAAFLVQWEAVPGEAHEPAVRADVARRDYASGRAMETRGMLGE